MVRTQTGKGRIIGDTSMTTKTQPGVARIVAPTVGGPLFRRRAPLFRAWFTL